MQKYFGKKWKAEAPKRFQVEASLAVLFCASIPPGLPAAPLGHNFRRNLGSAAERRLRSAEASRMCDLTHRAREKIGCGLRMSGRKRGAPRQLELDENYFAP